MNWDFDHEETEIKFKHVAMVLLISLAAAIVCFACGAVAILMKGF